MQGIFTVLRNKTQAERYAKSLIALDFTKPYAVKLQEYKPPKTNSQTAYAHSIIGYIALAKSEQAKQVKIDAKREWGVIEVSTSSITGERTARLKSFSMYSKEEMKTFLHQAESYCDENSIYYVKSET